MSANPTIDPDTSRAILHIREYVAATASEPDSWNCIFQRDLDRIDAQSTPLPASACHDSPPGRDKTADGVVKTPYKRNGEVLDFTTTAVEYECDGKKIRVEVTGSLALADTLSELLRQLRLQ